MGKTESLYILAEHTIKNYTTEKASNKIEPLYATFNDSSNVLPIEKKLSNFKLSLFARIFYYQLIDHSKCNDFSLFKEFFAFFYMIYYKTKNFATMLNYLSNKIKTNRSYKVQPSLVILIDEILRFESDDFVDELKDFLDESNKFLNYRIYAVISALDGPLLNLNDKNRSKTKSPRHIEWTQLSFISENKENIDKVAEYMKSQINISNIDCISRAKTLIRISQGHPRTFNRLFYIILHNKNENYLNINSTNIIESEKEFLELLKLSFSYQTIDSTDEKYKEIILKELIFGDTSKLEREPFVNLFPLYAYAYENKESETKFGILANEFYYLCQDLFFDKRYYKTFESIIGRLFSVYINLQLFNPDSKLYKVFSKNDDVKFKIIPFEDQSILIEDVLGNVIMPKKDDNPGFDTCIPLKRNLYLIENKCNEAEKLYHLNFKETFEKKMNVIFNNYVKDNQFILKIGNTEINYNLENVKFIIVTNKRISKSFYNNVIEHNKSSKLKGNYFCITDLDKILGKTWGKYSLFTDNKEKIKNNAINHDYLVRSCRIEDIFDEKFYEEY